MVMIFYGSVRNLSGRFETPTVGSKLQRSVQHTMEMSCITSLTGLRPVIILIDSPSWSTSDHGMVMISYWSVRNFIGRFEILAARSAYDGNGINHITYRPSAGNYFY